MARRKRRGVWILTSTGLDGAAAAAMVLQAVPDAEILLTSKNRVADTLRALGRSARDGSRVHVCGVGTGEALEEVLAALRALREADVAVTWYCGRGYLDGVAEALGAACETVFVEAKSNTDCIFQHLKPKRDALVTLLLDLGAAFVEKREAALARDQRWWRDLVQAATVRTFQLDDEEALPRAIRQLANLEETTSRDHALVEREQSRESLALPLGRSPAMLRLRRLIARVAPVEEPVLILGPSGAGKEIVARSVHDASLRSDGPFRAVNCAVLSASSDMAQDRLFGHTRGAFTGATREQSGAFAVADGGTLFLDEVAELPLDVQTQLLRVLEEKSYTPVGTMTPRRVDVRVIAATNRDLGRMVVEGAFRLDLFYRLHVLALRVPALTERMEDLPTIADAVRHRLEETGYALTLDEADWAAVRAYGWPGNIRQFRNVLTRAACMGLSVAEAVAEEQALGLDRLSSGRGADHSPPAPETGTSPPVLRGSLWPMDPDAILPEKDVQEAYVQHCLRLCEGNITEASRRLRIAPNTLRKRLRG